MDAMELDGVSIDILKAANMDVDALKTLSKEDLRDLFPGPEHFLRRKSIWEQLNSVEQASTSSYAPTVEVLNKTIGAGVNTDSNISSEGNNNNEEEEYICPPKTLKLPSPQYIMYTDRELENARTYYFQQKKAGRGFECELSKELTCRLIRNTITNMVSSVRASEDEDHIMYPTREDLQAMAKRLVSYYPMLSDKLDVERPWFEIFKRLNKRMQNVRTPRKRQGSTPARGKKRRLQFAATDDTDECDSNASTVILTSSPSSTHSTPERMEIHSPVTSTPLKKADVGQDSRMAQARHYKHLQEMYRKGKQNQDAVAQLLDLEFEGRRQFIDSEVLKEADRPGKIIEAYECFKNIDHVLEELRRIVARDNVNYVTELKERWVDFRTKLTFYGVYKKALRPPVSLPADEQAIDLITALPTMFPSGFAAPKKMRSPSEALIHVMQPTEDPDTYLRRRPLSTPLVLVEKDGDCFLCVGNAPVTSFPRSCLGESVLYIMAYYYAFHMTYPKCVASVLSILQTEVLGDEIHEKDTTTAFKRAKADWQAFLD